MEKKGWGFLLLGLLLLSGCMGNKTYLLQLKNDPPRTASFLDAASKPVALTLYQFQDARTDRFYLGRRMKGDHIVDLYKPDGGTVEEIFTDTFIGILEKSGFKVTLIRRYLNPEKDDFKDIPGDVAFSGKIEVLWVEAKSGLVTTDTTAKIRLRLNWGFVKERTWVSKTIEGSAQESERPLYQPRYAEAKINEVFKDALNNLFKDEVLLREKLWKIK